MPSRSSFDDSNTECPRSSLFHADFGAVASDIFLPEWRRLLTQADTVSPFLRSNNLYELLFMSNCSLVVNEIAVRRKYTVNVLCLIGSQVGRDLGVFDFCLLVRRRQWWFLCTQALDRLFDRCWLVEKPHHYGGPYSSPLDAL